MEAKKIIEELLLERDAEMVHYSTEEAIKSHKERCDYLIKLLDKQEQGLLIELPCKVGDTVYVICPVYVDHRIKWGVKEKVFDSITLILNNKDFIGETIFLTRSEAEEALARMKGE